MRCWKTAQAFYNLPASLQKTIWQCSGYPLQWDLWMQNCGAQCWALQQHSVPAPALAVHPAGHGTAVQTPARHGLPSWQHPHSPWWTHLGLKLSRQPLTAPFLMQAALLRGQAAKGFIHPCVWENQSVPITQRSAWGAERVSLMAKTWCVLKTLLNVGTEAFS